MIKGIKYSIFHFCFLFSSSFIDDGVNIITNPNIIVNAEQYIIINRYDIYSAFIFCYYYRLLLLLIL